MCEDLVKEFKKYDKKKPDENGNWQQSKYFKTYTHKPSNGGKPFTIDVGYERFLGPEMFFHPEFVNQDWKSPIDEIVDMSIQSCPMDYRRQLYSKIILSGGSTMFEGFDKRL